MADKRRVLSCIQPTSEMHIGNYFGAVANWVNLQEEHDCVFGIVDLHAITVEYKPDELRRNTKQMFIDTLACGVDPEKAILFIQSLVPEHTELGWLFSCLTSYGDLGRMTQFKDKSQQLSSDFVSAGLLTYPILQTADILIYRADSVPVGQDQEQHLELCRTTARRFNQRYDVEYFAEPKALFTTTPKIMSLSDPTRKMSKSAGPKHYLGVFEDENSMRKKVKSAVTDSGEAQGEGMSPGVENLITILDACGAPDQAAEFRKEYANGTIKYSELKPAVADVLVAYTSPFRERRAELQKQPDLIKKMMYEMSGRAREIARATMKEVYRIAGLPKRV